MPVFVYLIFICEGDCTTYRRSVEQILTFFLAHFDLYAVQLRGFERSFSLFSFFDGRTRKSSGRFLCFLSDSPIPRPLPPRGEGELFFTSKEACFFLVACIQNTHIPLTQRGRG